MAIMEYSDNITRLDSAIRMYRNRTGITYILYGAYILVAAYTLFILTVQLMNPIEPNSPKFYHAQQITEMLGLVNIILPLSIPKVISFITRKPRLELAKLMAGRNGKVTRVRRHHPQKCRIRIFGFTFPGEAKQPVTSGEEIVVSSTAINRKSGSITLYVQDLFQ